MGSLGKTKEHHHQHPPHHHHHHLLLLFFFFFFYFPASSEILWNFRGKFVFFLFFFFFFFFFHPLRPPLFPEKKRNFSSPPKWLFALPSLSLSVPSSSVRAFFLFQSNARCLLLLFLLSSSSSSRKTKKWNFLLIFPAAAAGHKNWFSRRKRLVQFVQSAALRERERERQTLEESCERHLTKEEEELDHNAGN